MTFSNELQEELDDTFFIILNRAHDNVQKKVDAKFGAGTDPFSLTHSELDEALGSDTLLRTIETYDNLQDQLDKKGELSEAQCKIVAIGCDFNNLDCPQDVLDRAVDAGYRPKAQTKPQLKKRTPKSKNGYAPLNETARHLEEAIEAAHNFEPPWDEEQPVTPKKAPDEDAIRKEVAGIVSKAVTDIFDAMNGGACK